MNIQLKRLNQSGFDHIVLGVVFVVLFALIGTYLLVTSRAATSYVRLHIGTSSGVCLESVSLAGCSSTSANEAWSLPHVANFQIENENNQCLDDWNGKVGNNSNDRVALRTYTCYSGDKHQEWNWHDSHLVNTATGGCISGIGGTESSGGELIIYPCVYSGTSSKITSSDQTWVESTISAPASSEQQTLCKQFGYGSGGSSCQNIGVAMSYMASSGNATYKSWAGNDTQLECLGELWNRESGWNNLIINSSSGAFGIAQALGHGASGTTAEVTADLVGGGTERVSVNAYPTLAANEGQATAQMSWGLGYISSSYSTPCGAWSHETNYGWYIART